MNTHNLCFDQKYEKYQNFSLKFSYFGGKSFNIFEKACLRNVELNVAILKSVSVCFHGEIRKNFSTLFLKKGLTGDMYFGWKKPQTAFSLQRLNIYSYNSVQLSTKIKPN